MARLFPSLCFRYSKESSSMGFHFHDCLDCRASLKLLEQLPTPFIPRFPFPFHQMILSLPAQIFIFYFILKPQRSKAVFFFIFYLLTCYVHRYINRSNSWVLSSPSDWLHEKIIKECCGSKIFALCCLLVPIYIYIKKKH